MSRRPNRLKLTAAAGILFIAAGASTALTAPMSPRAAEASRIPTPETTALPLSSCHKNPSLPSSAFQGILQLSARQLKTLVAALNPPPDTNS